MTSNFKIHIAPETFRKNTIGSVCGSIWIKNNNADFPSTEWQDFPVIILSWWMRELSDVLFEKKEQGKCRFMDGPFWFYLTVSENEYFTLTFCQDSKVGVEVLLKGKVSKDEFFSNLLSTTKTVIALCHKAKWLSNDLKILSDYYSELAEYLKR